MPCYCDTPSDDDQKEIERICKERMYFDSIYLLTVEQAQLCYQKDIKQFPYPDVNTALCKLCSILTKEQMEKISAYHWQIKWPHKTLYDWYAKHLEDDK
jgi:hypothetical protein